MRTDSELLAQKARAGSSTTQDIFIYDIFGEDAQGKIRGRHRSTGIGRPKFWDRARYFNEEVRLAAALDAANADSTVEKQAR
jgi:pilus assembly protein CpaF